MFLRLLSLLLITISATVLHGKVTERWQTSEALAEANRVVSQTPKQLGGWDFVADSNPINEAVARELGLTEYVNRVYGKGSDTVSLLFMAGKTSRLIRHTPDICYEATGNTFLKDPTPATLVVDGTMQEFRVLPIRPTSELSGDFVVVYGFAHGDQFLSPANPRLTYHGLPAINKIQVLCSCDPTKLGEIPEHAKPFIEEICRYLKKAEAAR